MATFDVVIRTQPSLHPDGEPDRFVSICGVITCTDNTTGEVTKGRAKSPRSGGWRRGESTPGWLRTRANVEGLLRPQAGVAVRCHRQAHHVLLGVYATPPLTERRGRWLPLPPESPMITVRPVRGPHPAPVASPESALFRRSVSSWYAQWKAGKAAAAGTSPRPKPLGHPATR